MAAIVVRGHCSSFHGRWGRFGVFVVVGQSQSWSLPSFGCGDRCVGQLSSCWAAGMVCGGMGRVTWHAGDMAMWSSHLCGCCVSFAGSCHSSWMAGVVIGGGVYLWVTWW